MPSRSIRGGRALADRQCPNVREDVPGRSHPHRVRFGPSSGEDLPDVQAQGPGGETFRYLEDDAPVRSYLAPGRRQRLRAYLRLVPVSLPAASYRRDKCWRSIRRPTASRAGRPS
jgi:hypothetical protein